MAASTGRLPQIAPMLAAPARDVPANADDWAAEAKWDGAMPPGALSADVSVAGIVRRRIPTVLASAGPAVDHRVTLCRVRCRRRCIA